MKVGDYIDAVIDREGGYSNHPADRGGPTKFGITQAVARAHGYYGDMRLLPRETAVAIYLERYWLSPRFDRVNEISPMIAEELLDTGVNMGPGVASRFLQRSLNVLNQQGTLYPDLVVDGAIGPMTLHALKDYKRARPTDGMRVLWQMLNALQSVRYIEIAEANPTQEAFQFGWQANRVTMQP